MDTQDEFGIIEIDPPLNRCEQAYLAAFAASRRCRRVDGPYAVPGNPAAEADVHDITEAVLEAEGPSFGTVVDAEQVADGQPGLWCPWGICSAGCCLSCDGISTVEEAAAWLQYLIDHFLGPGAQAAKCRPALFAAFTFDHRLEGIVVLRTRRRARSILVRVVDNEIVEELLPPEDARREMTALLARAAMCARERCRCEPWVSDPWGWCE